jgi:hypothetical protein
MSSSLQWRPTHSDTDSSLSCALKFALREQYGEPINVTLTSYDVDYLKGLLHGGIKDAQILLTAIENHKSIDVKEVW